VVWPLVSDKMVRPTMSDTMRTLFMVRTDATQWSQDPLLGDSRRNFVSHSWGSPSSVPRQKMPLLLEREAFPWTIYAGECQDIQCKPAVAHLWRAWRFGCNPIARNFASPPLREFRQRSSSAGSNRAKNLGVRTCGTRVHLIRMLSQEWPPLNMSMCGFLNACLWPKQTQGPKAEMSKEEIERNTATADYEIYAGNSNKRLAEEVARRLGLVDTCSSTDGEPRPGRVH